MKTMVALFSAAALWALSAPSMARDISTHGAAADDDEILLISSRGYPTVIGRTFNFDSARAHVLDAAGHSIPTCLPLHSLRDSKETWLFVHGNQISPCEAVQRGVRIYRSLRSCACCDGPIRFVIWSWPSERNVNRVKDAKRKAVRTDVEAFLLGSVLTHLAGETPISVVGYSFGSRIVAGALHLAAGGQLCGFCLPHSVETEVPFRVVHIAAAVEADGFSRCGRYSRALTDVGSLTLLNNSRDAALNFFWIMQPSKPKALGDCGLCRVPCHVQLQQTDWKRCAGRDHSIWQYIDRPSAVRHIVTGLAH